MRRSRMSRIQRRLMKSYKKTLRRGGGCGCGGGRSLFSGGAGGQLPLTHTPIHAPTAHAVRGGKYKKTLRRRRMMKGGLAFSDFTSGINNSTNLFASSAHVPSQMGLISGNGVSATNSGTAIHYNAYSTANPYKV